MICAKCKGRLLCGRKKCPLLVKFKLRRKVEVGEIERPTPPSVFVGRFGYPKVLAGPLIAMDYDNPEFLDSPQLWKGSVEDVMVLRMSLVRGMKICDVRREDRFVETLREAVASIRHVEVESRIVKVVERPVFDDVLQPIGVSAEIDGLKITENPKIPKKVEKIWNDEMKAVEGVKYLFDSGFSTYYIQKLFSVGILGMEKRMVPTRWSITAVHDLLGESLKEEIAEFKSVNDSMLFSYEHFGNRFKILITPGEFSFNLVEVWRKGSFWSPKTEWIGIDSETIRRKKRYSDLGGGYYAARLPVLEYLRRIRRKGRIFVVREITPEYYAPLGVWVVEEGIRRALERGERVDEDVESDFLRSFEIQTTLSDFCVE